MPSDHLSDHASEQALVFAALGDETRLRLVSRLGTEGPLSLSRLAFGEGITRQAITKHLRTMESASLVSQSRHGRETVWRLERETFEEARRHLDAISRQWDEALGRLRSQVEEPEEL
jgi:DNA-binding transcriptional ArsR family regulator